MTLNHVSETITPPADPLLVRGIRVTWLFTFWGILAFEALVMFVWMPSFSHLLTAPWQLVGTAVGGLVWVAASIVLLNEYHRIRTTGDEPNRLLRSVSLATAALFGIFLFIAWGLWPVALLPLIMCVLLLPWRPGLRSRVTVALTALLVVLVIRDGLMLADQPQMRDSMDTWWATSVYVSVIPALCVFSLWWWDVVIQLDQARAAESRLAATQERLRLATDVHDLQGHHLQVIALQLELTERMLERDPAAALTHLKEARTSVDAARQGTRDLALPFQGIPIVDEIANAADLIIAAGAKVTVNVEQSSAEAPADVLGPVIRETTTNVLKHGGGSWSHLSLLRHGAGWRYEISNDVAPPTPHPKGDRQRKGTGIDGMRRRLSEAGGSLELAHTEDTFVIVAEVNA